MVTGPDGKMVRERMNLSILLQSNMNAAIMIDCRAVGSVEVEPEA